MVGRLDFIKRTAAKTLASITLASIDDTIEVSYYDGKVFEPFLMIVNVLYFGRPTVYV